MTATLEMQKDKTLLWIGSFTVYRYETNADDLAIVAPRYYGEQDLSLTQARICFALGAMGDYAELSMESVNDSKIVYHYAIGGALTSQSGEYRVWLEFRLWDAAANVQSFCLCSEMETLMVQAHRDASTLLQGHCPTFFTQLEERLQAYETECSAALSEALAAARDAKTNAEAGNAQANEAKTEVENAKTQLGEMARSVEGVQKAQSELQQKMTQYFKNGDSRLCFGSSTAIFSPTQGSVVINDNNRSTQLFNLTFGGENTNGAWGGLVGGYQNRATNSQQAVLGEGNVAPFSKNLTVMGQFCCKDLRNAQGETLTDVYDARRPLLLVGNGKNDLDRSDAFAVFADGEAVLYDAEGALPIAKTLREQEGKLSDLARRVESGTTASGGFCLGVADWCKTLAHSNIRCYPDNWVESQYFGTKAQAEILRSFLLARETDPNVPLYLDPARTVALGGFESKGKSVYGTYWSYAFYFPCADVSFLLYAYETDENGNVLETTLETAKELSIRVTKGNCLMENPYLHKNEYSVSIEPTFANETIELDLTDVYREVLLAGKRFFSLFFEYYLRGSADTISSLFPVCLDESQGRASVFPGGSFGFRYSSVGYRVILSVTPQVFGWSEWKEAGTNMGETLFLRFDLL